MIAGFLKVSKVIRAAALLALLLAAWSLPGCGGNGGNLTSTGLGTSATAATASDGSAGTRVILVEGYGDSAASPLPALVLSPGTTRLSLKVGSAGGLITEVATHDFTVTNSNPRVISASLSADVLTVTTNPGRATLHLKVPALDIDRYLGVLVKHQDGGLPGLPGHAYYPTPGRVARASSDLSGANHVFLGVQSVADDSLWMTMSGGHMPDMRSRYLNNGFSNGWFAWVPDGAMVTNYVNSSNQYGMLPVFVYYQVPGGSEDNPPGVAEGAEADYTHLQSSDFMKRYFTDLYRALRRMGASGKPVAIILEPDFLGYMMQTYSGTSFGTRPAQIPAAGLPGAAQVMEEDDSGNATTTPILQSGEVPGASGNNVRSFVLTVNYLVTKYAPNAQFGWEASHWASGAQGHTVPGGGIAHFTDVAMQTLATHPTDPTALADFQTARTNLSTESKLIAQWYVDAGCTTGATFISCDKYGVDGADPAPTDGDAAPNGTGYLDPPSSAYFWNAVQWNNYLLFIKQLHTTTSLDVLLWQLPTGHLNGSTATSAGPVSGGWPGVSAGATFPDLADIAIGTNTFTQSYGCWEESGPPFLLGDTFVALADPNGKQTAAQRFAWFGQSDPDFPSDVTTNQGTLSITWAEHMTRARSYGAIGIIIGPGVGQATQNLGWQDQWTDAPPTDGFWFLNKLVKYLANPVALP